MVPTAASPATISRRKRSSVGDLVAAVSVQRRIASVDSGKRTRSVSWDSRSPACQATKSDQSFDRPQAHPVAAPDRGCRSPGVVRCVVAVLGCHRVTSDIARMAEPSSSGGGAPAVIGGCAGRRVRRGCRGAAPDVAQESPRPSRAWYLIGHRSPSPHHPPAHRLRGLSACRLPPNRSHHPTEHEVAGFIGDPAWRSSAGRWRSGWCWPCWG